MMSRMSVIFSMHLFRGDGSPGALIMDSQFPQVEIFIPVVFHHFGASDEGYLDLPVRQDRQHRCDLFDGVDIEFGAQFGRWFPRAKNS